MNIRLLKWFLLSGVTENIGETPVNRFARKAPVIVPPTPTTAPVKTTAPEEPTTLLAAQAAATADTLEALRAAVNGFDACPLKKTAAHTFTGTGVTEKPKVLCLIESPKADDERSGQFLSGEAGTLLQKMLGAIGLSTTDNTYVAPLIPWRLPGDRKPTDAEIAACVPFAKRLIELLQPDYLLVLGAIPAKVFLNVGSVAQGRGKMHAYSLSDGSTVPALITFSPDVLMKNATYKRSAWEDLQRLQRDMSGGVA